MKRIKLTKGKSALISNIDSDLSKYNWHYDGRYAVRNAPQRKRPKTIWMHRLILGRMGFNNFKETDHKNGDKLDNRRSNLRPATNMQNQANRKINSNNSSGYRGVNKHKGTGKWRAYININYKQHHLGLFPTKKPRKHTIKLQINILVNLQS